jgi:transposase-like protein
MDLYPRTLMEFERRFGAEDDCRSYLEQLRWPAGFRCPACGGTDAWRMSRGLWLCRKCRRQTSVTVGTIFERSRLPLSLWFRAMWHITNQKNGASALTVQRLLGLGSYQTAWAWLHKLRRAMVRPGRDRLSGVVEVDESYVGGKQHGKRGRGAPGKALVVLAVQLQTGNRIGRIRLCHVADASGRSLVSAAQSMVAEGGEVRTDGWRGYNGLATKGYHHVVVRSTAEVGEDLLPACHRVASLLKRWLLGTHQGAIRGEHLAYYLDEFTFRFNRRTSASRGMLFYRLAQQAVQVPPVPYLELIAPPPIVPG